MTDETTCQHYIIAEYLRIDLDQRFACSRCGAWMMLTPEAGHAKAQRVERLEAALREIYGWPERDAWLIARAALDAGEPAKEE